MAAISATASGAVAQTPTDARTGTVRILEGLSTVVLVNGRGESITIAPAAQTVPLPAGRYHIDSWTSERRDEQGNTWRLRGCNFGGRGAFEVVPGKNTRLSIGEPVFSSLTARKEDSTYLIGHRLAGQLAESVEITCNGSRPSAPELRIRNAEGSCQVTLAFAYG